jgi:pimeloyl-ACP methyl ester carboxylesterase
MKGLSGLTDLADLAEGPRAWMKRNREDGEAYKSYYHDLGFILDAHTKRAAATSVENWGKNLAAVAEASGKLVDPLLGLRWLEYLVDSGQRALLFSDALRRRGNFFVEHEEDGNKTVLSWDHEVVIHGESLNRPVNYSLVRIKPPPGVTVCDDCRPYIIIDPRAGHGSGIGGFKNESEVGAAIYNGHPTYFVTFTRLPVKNQTLADVAAAEAVFVRQVRRLHPDSPNPVIVGNCQGGWAAMLLAATNPDITGPVVANGAPLSYWAGQKGNNPMRYLGGLTGGAATVRLISDLGNGLFDGANLVYNFERLSPGNTWWTKYYSLWDKIDTETERFVGFERWWGSFYYMTEEEITWVIDNLFVGNRLGRGTAHLNERIHLDLRAVNTPIIIFASHGDNITPPQQALGWIADYYSSVEEIRARGQRILYTLHDSVGHLGIFVSSSVAKKEHEQIVSTLKTLEALPPGLYEMVITEERGEGVGKSFKVAFAERTIKEMMTQAGGDDSDRPFAAVARFSELGSEFYDLALRPFVQAVANKGLAEMIAHTGPMRLPRWLQSDRNPLMQPVKSLAAQARSRRVEVAPDHPFRMVERFGAGLVRQWWDSVRDIQDGLIEWNFHLLWASPPVQKLGEGLSRTVSSAPQEDLHNLSSVQDALDRIAQGGFPEAVIRMLIFLAQSRREVRRSRLERSNKMLLTTEPFASMPPKQRTKMIHRESLIVGFEPERALAALPELIPLAPDRRRALELCLEIAGPVEEMSLDTIVMLNRLTLILEPLDQPAEAEPAALVQERKL